MVPRPRVAVCDGSDCRSRIEHADLERSLGRVAEVVPVRCLGLCRSPVAVVLGAGGDHVVYERLRKPKLRRDLVTLIARGGEPSGRLSAHRVTGKSRHKVLVRLARRLPR